MKDSPVLEHRVHQVRRRREVQAAKTAGTGLVAQIINYAIRAAVIPVSLRVLGVERYGLWLAIGSLVAWGGLADLGLSTGLVNVVAKSSSDAEVTELRRHISTALAVYAGVATILVAAALSVAHWGALPRLLGVSNNASLAGDARLLAAVCGVAFAASIWLQNFTTICSGLQEGYLGSLPVLAGGLASFALLLVLKRHGSSSLLSYAGVVLLPPLAAQLGLGVFVFGWRHPELTPSWRLCNRRSLKMLFSIGGPMSLDQIATIGILYSANVLVANRLSPATVPKYAIPYSLFAIVNGAAYLIVNSYMPAYAEASGSADWLWIRFRAVRSLYITMALVAAVDATMVVGGRTVIEVWAGREVVPTLGFLVALASFGVLRAYSEANGVLLVGLGLVRTKALLQLMVAAAIIGGGWFLLPRLGLVTIPVLGSIGCGLSGAFALPCALRLLRAREADARSIPLGAQKFLQQAASAE